MSLGLSILLSSILLSVLALFVATKDRWNWKKIIFIPPLVVLPLILGLFGIFSVAEWVKERPKKLEEFWGVPLRASKADVLFLKGEPDVMGDPRPSKDGERTLEQWSFSDDRFAVRVGFQEDTVWYVMLESTSTSVSPTIAGLKPGASLEAVEAKFGEPSEVSHSSDELKRVICYADFQVCFAFEKNELNVYGAFDPEFGSLVYADPDESDDD